MAENDVLAAAVRDLAWELARRGVAGERRMEVASPWETGLGQEQRRAAWLATLAALEAVRAEAGRLAEAAASHAAEFGADPEEIAATGAARRRRWARLLGREWTVSGAELGTLAAHGRAASSRLDNLPPV
ncbi:hypothetical protein [Actinoplanes subglobosus]|uniref:Uncharacterized protein n=1 Tax=Actinoplanes subglobosus TaxID=1547892 RepID=A0ABV8J2I4_9ACTN